MHIPLIRVVVPRALLSRFGWRRGRHVKSPHAEVHPLEARTALCSVGAAPVAEAALAAPAPVEVPAVVVEPAPPAADVRPAARKRRGAGRPGPVQVLAENLTTPTLCAEVDNVNVPLSVDRPLSGLTFTVEAHHPAYPVAEDHRAADFGNCPAVLTAGGGGPQQVFHVYDDHVATALEAVSDPNFHEPGMRVRVGAASVNDVHFVRLIRRIGATDSWPEVLVLYSDGNLRLKPQAPPEGGDPAYGGDPVFGSSLIVGPAPRGERPVAQIRSVSYVPSKGAFRLKYEAGGAATLRLLRADREGTRVQVVARYPTSPQVPFATLRSMFVREGNADVDTVQWQDPSGAVRGTDVATFGSARGTAFGFGRSMTSLHNTSAPDVWVGDLVSRKR